jgi:predicted transcriptional regulator
MQSEKFVEETFRGSLPAFIAAFGSRKKPTPAELEEIRALLDKFGEG